MAVFGDALVDKVLFAADRAVAVRVRMAGRWRQVRGGEIILSAGAVHSPAILMRSGVGPPAHLAELGVTLEAALPVGQAFQDYPVVFLPIALEPHARPPTDFRHTNACLRY